MRSFIPAAMLLLLAAQASIQADTYPRQPNVDAVHYAFSLELNDENPEIVGSDGAPARALLEPVR